MTSRARATTREDLGAALSRAVDYLRGARDEEGLWCDFETLAGCSIDWVTGHVVASIACAPGTWALCEPAVGALVARQRSSGGWGYHERIPEDADSTACVLRALASTRFVSPHVSRAARAFLASHQIPGGGYTTFRRLDAIGAVIGEADRGALGGWGSAHACVSANVVLAQLEIGVPPTSPGLAAALDYLQLVRRDDGLWYSYWWNGPAFATYHALLALTLAGRAGRHERACAARGLIALSNADGAWSDAGSAAASQPLATAFALLTLALAPTTPTTVDAATSAVDRLLEWQRPDGSWPTVPILRIPDAHVVDPGQWKTGASRPGTGIIVADQRRVFTTAAVTHALELHRRTIVGRHAVHS